MLTYILSVSVISLVELATSGVPVIADSTLLLITLISLLTEVLEYQKKYGLLWSEVTEIMSQSPEKIANFIRDNNSEYWN